MNDKLSTMPCIQLSKENLELMKDMLSTEEAGKLLFDMYDYIYGNGELPEGYTKPQVGVWNNVLSFVMRRAEKWLNQTKNFRENNPKKNNKYNNAVGYGE